MGLLCGTGSLQNFCFRVSCLCSSTTQSLEHTIQNAVSGGNDHIYQCTRSYIGHLSHCCFTCSYVSPPCNSHPHLHDPLPHTPLHHVLANALECNKAVKGFYGSRLSPSALVNIFWNEGGIHRAEDFVKQGVDIWEGQECQKSQDDLVNLEHSIH